MKKKNLILLFLASNIFFIKAQNIEVTYYFKEGSSNVYSANLITTDTLKVFEIKDTEIENDTKIFQEAKSISINSVKKKAENRFLFQKTKEPFIYTKLNIGKNFYIIKRNLPVLDWQLTQETKIILGMKCGSALLKLDNRTYIAYYTEELAISNGPWFFDGLPGLILELKDTEEKIHFIANKISRNTNPDLSKFTKAPTNTISLDEFKKLTYKDVRKRKAFIESLAAEVGGEATTDIRGFHIDFEISEFDKF